MSNPVTLAISNTKLAGDFMVYIGANIKTIKLPAIINAEFVIQLGVILSYLEDNHNIGIHATTYSYVVYYIDVKKNKALHLLATTKSNHLFEKYNTKVKDMRASIFDNYGDAIIRTFYFLSGNKSVDTEDDLPF